MANNYCRFNEFKRTAVIITWEEEELTEIVNHHDNQNNYQTGQLIAFTILLWKDSIDLLQS